MKMLKLMLAFTLAPFAFSASPSAYGSPQSGTKESAAAPDLPAVQTLRLTDTIVIPSSAPDSYSPQLKCDSGGDIFVRLAEHNPTGGFDSAITEILPSSQQIKKYGSSPLSASDFPNARLESFDVRPNGTVYALIFTQQDKPADGGPQPRPEYYVERFNGDGTADSIPRLEAPPGAARWSPILLGIFTEGNILITGYKVEAADAPNHGARKPLTAIYDSRGRFIHDVILPDDVSSEGAGNSGPVQSGVNAPSPSAPAKANAQSSEPANADGDANPTKTQAASVKLPKTNPSFGPSITTGEVVNGPDGNVWILRKSAPLRLYAVSSSGEVVKHFQFPTLVEGLKPVSFGFSGPEEFFFQFELGSEIRPSGPLSFLAIFNTETEHFEARYVPPELTKGFRFPACSDHHGGFFYFGASPDNFLSVFDFKP
jgi:hypothetical protein